TTSYVYDADGTRLIAHDPSGATLYLGSQEVHAGGSTTSCTRYYGPNAVRTTAGGLSWTTEDHQGTTQFSFAAGTLAKTQRRAAPFGGPRGSAPAWPTTRGFVGGTDDASTGLVHLGAREYDPGLGRFIPVDPE